MATESDEAGAFRRRCLIAAAADALACWEEYAALVRAAAEDPPRAGSATRRAELREELHQARTALITAVTVRRMAVEEIEAERDEAGDDEDEVFPLDDLRDDGPL
jgi:hypothetical protein